MGAVDLEDVMGEAHQAAFSSLHAACIHLSVAVTADGMIVVTSPDVDWLVVTSRTREHACSVAVWSLLRVAGWCGAELGLPRIDQG